jgi:hypothetical protein
VQVGNVVVLVDGGEAGREGQIMSVRDNMLMVGCLSRDRLWVVMAHTCEVLPQELFRPLCARERDSK